MKPKTRNRTRCPWLVFVAAVVTIVGVLGAASLSQWEETVRLRAERELGRMQLRDAERLRAENLRLRGEQISAAQLDAFRADHAALIRLRAELNTLTRPESR